MKTDREKKISRFRAARLARIITVINLRGLESKVRVIADG